VLVFSLLQLQFRECNFGTFFPLPRVQMEHWRTLLSSFPPFFPSLLLLVTSNVPNDSKFHSNFFPLPRVDVVSVGDSRFVFGLPLPPSLSLFPFPVSSEGVSWIRR